MTAKTQFDVIKNRHSVPMPGVLNFLEIVPVEDYQKQTTTPRKRVICLDGKTFFFDPSMNVFMVRDETI